MRIPTEDEITAAVKEHAFERGGQWFFNGSLKSRDYTEVRDVVEVCLRLDVVPTDLITAAAWVLLVRAVAELEDQVDQLLWAGQTGGFHLHTEVVEK